MSRFLDQESATAVAWDGRLEPSGEVMRGGGAPRVSLGQPVHWDAAAALHSELGQQWTPPDPTLAYTLIRLSCTLHPPDDDGDRYTAVRLEAPLRLLNSNDGRANSRAIAHDLFPLRQTAPESGTFNLGLTPEFKFAKVVEVKLGEIGVEKNYAAVFPIIQGYGLGEANPYWQFQAHAQFPLQGSQKVYLLAAAPQGATLSLRLRLAATVKHRRWGLIPYGPPQTADARLTFTIPPSA